MKILFISDVHSNLHALEKVLEYIENLDVDEIFCCGDIVGYNAFPSECLKIIRRNNIKSVMGNHDWAVTTGDTSGFNPYGVAGVEYSRKKLLKEEIEFLKRLPKNISFSRDDISFYVAHGSPRDNIFEYVFPNYPESLFNLFARMVDAEITVLGHTHIPMERIVDGKIFLNPGSVGQPRDSNSNASFMIFDTEDRTYKWYRVAYDVDSAADAIRKSGLPLFLAERLHIGL